MAILFDLDGTLIDTAPDFQKAVVSVRSSLGLSDNPSLNDIRLAVPNGIKGLTQTGFSDQLNIGNNEHTLSDQLLDQYEQNLGKHAQLFEGIEPLLTTLESNNIPWGVVTNKETRFTDPLLKALKLFDRAACVVSGDTTAHSKPHPEPLLYACAQIHKAPEHCVYVGDAERDIIAGRNAGMTTVAALFGYIENSAIAKSWGADHYVEHPDQILPWFEQWQKNR